MPKPSELRSRVEEVREESELKTSTAEPTDFIDLDQQSAEMSPLDMDAFGEERSPAVFSEGFVLDGGQLRQQGGEQLSGVSDVFASQGGDKSVNGEVTGLSRRENHASEKPEPATTLSPSRPQGQCFSANPRKIFQHS